MRGWGLNGSSVNKKTTQWDLYHITCTQKANSKIGMIPVTQQGKYIQMVYLFSQTIFLLKVYAALKLFIFYHNIISQYLANAVFSVLLTNTLV